jgi:hypothetical protein
LASLQAGALDCRQAIGSAFPFALFISRRSWPALRSARSLISRAGEVAAGLPAASVVAAVDPMLRGQLADLLATQTFRVYGT